MSASPFPRHPQRVLAAALSCLFASVTVAPALAQGGGGTPAATAPGTATLPAVTVTDHRADGYAVEDTSSATKLRLSPRETPQSLTVVTRERMDNQNSTHLRDVLDNTPGVYSNAYDTERVLFHARGFPIDTLLYDGVPATRSFNTSSIDETIDTAFYDRIEIVRGATGLMSGAGSPAAAVNLFRKRADSKTFTGSAELSIGSWRAYRTVVDLASPLTEDGRIRGRLVAVGEDRHSYQNLYQKKKTGLYATLDADLTSTTQLSVGIDDQRNRPRGNTWGSFPMFLANGERTHWSRSVTTATDWAFWTRQTQTAFAELRQELGAGWSLRSTLSRRRYREDMALFYVSGFPDPVDGSGLEPFAYRSKGWTNENALDLYASGPFDLLGRRHELVVGYTGSRVKRRSYEYAAPEALAPTGNFFDWDGSYPAPPFASESTLASDIRNRQDGLYAAARLSVTDTVKAIAGARYSRWKTDAFDLYADPQASRYDQRKTVPYAGVIWDFLPGASAFASYTGIFNPQTARDINARFLDPIEGRSTEIGIKGQHLNGRLQSSLTLFETRQSNVASPATDPASGESIRLPDGSIANIAIDGTKTRGFELELTGRLNDEWQGSVGWTHYAIKDGDGERIRTYIPDKMVKLFTTWEPRRLVSGLKLGLGVNWQSATATPLASPNGEVNLRQGSVTLLSLMARYELTRNVEIQLNAFNALDRKYYVLDQYDNTYYGLPAGGTVSLRVRF